jgi:hypothetical protein
MKIATGMHQRRQISFVLKITMVVHSMYKSFPMANPISIVFTMHSRCLSWNPLQNLHFSVVFNLIQGVALTLSSMNLNLLQPRWWTTSSISTKVHDSCFYIWFTMHIQSRSIWIKECGFDIGLCTQTRDCNPLKKKILHVLVMIVYWNISYLKAVSITIDWTFSPQLNLVFL